MYNRKFFPLVLTFILVISLIIEPIHMLATVSDTTSGKNIVPLKVTESITYEGISIKEGTILFGEKIDEKQYQIPIHKIDEYVQLDNGLIEEVDPGLIDTSYFNYLDELVITEEQVYSSSNRFIDHNAEPVIEVIEEEVTLPLYESDNQIGMFLGYRLFPLEENILDSENKHLVENESSNSESAPEDETGTNEMDNLEDVESPDTTESKDNEDSDSLDSTSEEDSNRNNTEELDKDLIEDKDLRESRVNVQATMTGLRTLNDPWENSNAKYFKVIENNVPVYDNRTGKLVQIGTLVNGQTYPIVRDYGNWHRIQFGSYYGYVSKKSTIPSSKSAIANENKSYRNKSRTITALQDAPVYDNTSGSLVEFGKLTKGAEISIASDYGNWWRVIYSGRIGYINKSVVKANFQSGDKYFRVISNDTPVYDNRTGKLVKIGDLTKGQIYPISRDYGNWWRIQFSNYYGYVHKDNTEYAPNNLKNINKRYKNHSRTVVPYNDIPVYDNTSGKLVKYGTIKKGVTYHIATDYGNWWRIIYADRVGYIAKSDVKANFVSSDRYFTANSNLPIYDNRSGKLVKVGEVVAGQEYPIDKHYGNWWRIKFSNFYGYVNKSGTSPVTKPTYKNTKKNYKNSNKIVKTLRNTPVYDNTSGSLVQFGTISKDVNYPIVSDYGNWWRILFNDRVGYISKQDANNRMVKTTTYNISFNEALNIQMTATPKSDGAGKKAATRSEVSNYLNPANFAPNSASYFQFLLLDEPTSTKASELNSRFLRTYSQAGSLQGQGNAFVQAANRYGINEVYLVAHTLHETGNGTSTLASGVSRWTQMVPGTCTPVKDKNGKNVIIDISPRKVYNMYGVHAFDDCPLNAGAQYAYDNGWFTPAQAIIGGAGFIKNGYLNRGQNTLYKMRWDPATAASTGKYGKQYATHIAWADIQARSIARMYDQLTGYFLQFDVPQYKSQPGDGTPPPSQVDKKEVLPVKTYATITSSYRTINMRKDPSTRNEPIREIPRGARIEVLYDNGDNWYHIKDLASGQVGYITKGSSSNRYFTFDNLYRVSTSSGGLNVRDNPSTSGRPVGSLQKDEKISVVLDSNRKVVSHVANGYTWYKINFDGVERWVANDFLTKIN